MQTTEPSSSIVYRKPTPGDAGAVWRLVKESGALDANSAYCYMLLFLHFAETCLIAEREGRIQGFVTAYVPPTDSRALFVWQIAVAPEARGRGVAKALLRRLLELPAGRRAERLEATVSPNNALSRRLFEALARDRGAPCETIAGEGFAAEAFPEQGHEAEPLLRIRLKPDH
ncbi:diaminobutyrate acetyltransferase [Paenibacillus hodogayensis]|uniref:L-2,4-diaminobutyric acid acetyltransferase n=1 Tax=Paenibacillus hodogayensis TaxID=279208 RepID=A0ABV5VU38_9BACL